MEHGNTLSDPFGRIEYSISSLITCIYSSFLYQKKSREQIKDVIQSTLAFIISIFSTSPSVRIPPATPEELVGDGDFCAVLWNDESHSFNEVIGQVADATGMSVEEARVVAETVDSVVCALLLIVREEQLWLSVEIKRLWSRLRERSTRLN